MGLMAKRENPGEDSPAATGTSRQTQEEGHRLSVSETSRDVPTREDVGMKPGSSPKPRRARRHLRRRSPPRIASAENEKWFKPRSRDERS